MTLLSCRVVRPVAHGGRSGSAVRARRLLRQCARERLEQRRHRRERVARRAVARMRRDRQARRGAERRAHRRADRVDDRRRRVGARRQQRADCARRAAGRGRPRAEQAAAPGRPRTRRRMYQCRSRPALATRPRRSGPLTARTICRPRRTTPPPSLKERRGAESGIRVRSAAKIVWCGCAWGNGRPTSKTAFAPIAAGTTLILTRSAPLWLLGALWRS